MFYGNLRKNPVWAGYTQGTEFFPLTIKEHIELLNGIGFESAELFWNSYMQSGLYGLYGIK